MVSSADKGLLGRVFINKGIYNVVTSVNNETVPPTVLTSTLLEPQPQPDVPFIHSKAVMAVSGGGTQPKDTVGPEEGKMSKANCVAALRRGFKQLHHTLQQDPQILRKADQLKQDALKGLEDNWNIFP